MEHKERSLISASAVFLGLLLPLRFPQLFWQLLIGFSVISALMVFWVFGEKPNLKRLKEDWFTIIFLIFFTGISGLFAYLQANPLIQALLLGATGIILYFLYQVASRLKRGYRPSLFLRNITFYAAIFGVFFAITDILRWMTLNDNPVSHILIIVLSFISIFVISEFLFEVYGFETSLLYSLVFSFTISQMVWISSFWMISYPQSQRITVSGVPLTSILATIFYYLFWGISHHHLEEKLTRRVLWEYILISGLFVIILFATAKWTM